MSVFRMPRARVGVAALALVSAVSLAGCGPKAGTAADTMSTSSTSSSAAGTTATSGATGTGTASASPCPTENTRSFAKTRFVADVGLAAGSFHRYIYKPWQAHTFDKGAHGRVLAIAKAVTTAAADAKLLANATENAKASPALCGAVYGPLSAATAGFQDLKAKIATGDLTSIAGIESEIQSALGGSKANGDAVTETTS